MSTAFKVVDPASMPIHTAPVYSDKGYRLTAAAACLFTKSSYSCGEEKDLPPFHRRTGVRPFFFHMQFHIFRSADFDFQLKQLRQKQGNIHFGEEEPHDPRQEKALPQNIFSVSEEMSAVLPEKRHVLLSAGRGKVRTRLGQPRHETGTVPHPLFLLLHSAAPGYPFCKTPHLDATGYTFVPLPARSLSPMVSVPKSFAI